jgi:long-chain acyl-CoA synthetase
MLSEKTTAEPRLAAVSHGSLDFRALPDDQGLFSVIAEWARRDPGRPVLSRRTEAGWSDATSAQFCRDVIALAGRLLGWGVQHGDRIVVLGRTSYEWAVADFAALAIGAVTVPVFPTASAEQVRHLLTDSGASYGFAETPEQVTQLTAAASGQWRAPVQLLATATEHDSADSAAVADEVANEAGPGSFGERSSAVTADDIATIVYTSGTTGVPKGCVLTHRNMFASSANTVLHEPELFQSETSSTLLCLPLAHVFGRTVLVGCLVAGVRTGLLSSIPDLFSALPEFRPTFLALVPYALEKIRKQCRAGVGTAAEEVAVAYAQAQASQLDIPAQLRGTDQELRRAHQELDKTAFAAIRGMMGGQCEYVICGGASLDTTTEAFFNGVGVRILGAYGLTEAATAVTLNQPAAVRTGTAGRPIPGTTIAIAADGEVLVRGLNVSPGYWPLAPHSGKAEWLHTGDIGEIDDDGYLSITGRSKEILITNGGKNVAPAPLEDRIRLHSVVSNCMIVAEGRSFVSVLVTLDGGAASRWAAAHGIEPGDLPLREVPELLAEVQLAVDEANLMVSRAESIRAFRVLDGDFAIDNGQLTPSLKLRRSVIEHAYRDAIADIYR